MQSEDVKLQKRLNRLNDKAENIISKLIGINCAIKMLMRKEKQLTKEWGKTQDEIGEINKLLGEAEICEDVR